MRRVAVVLALVLVVLVCLSASVLWHLDTPLGREAGRQTLEELVSAEMAGRLEAGEVLSLSATEARLANVTLYDPDGRAVIVAERVRVRFEPLAATRGELRFPLGVVEDAELVLYEGESGLPTFIDAFGSATPSGPDDPFVPGSVLAWVEELRLERVRVRGTLLGVEGLIVEDVHARASLRIDDRIANGFDLRVHEARGRIVAPFGKELALASVRARVRDDANGTSLHATIESAEGELVAARLVYAPTEDASGQQAPGQQGSAARRDELDLLLRLDPVRARTLAESGLAPWADPLLGDVRGHVRLTGPPDALRLRAWLRTDGGRVGVDGVLASDAESRVTLRARELAIDRAVDGAPSAVVSGRVTFHLPPEGDPRVEAELDPFVLGELEIPASRVEGSLGEERFVVDSARAALGGGELEARGSIGYDGTVELRVTGDVRDVASDPTLRRLLPALRTGGRFEAELRVAEDGTIDARGRWVLTRFRYGPVYVGVLTATGSITGDVQAPELALRLGLQDLRVSDRRLGSGEGRIDGDPAAYRVRVATQEGARRVALEGRVDVRDGIRAEVTSLELREGRIRWTGRIEGLRSVSPLLEVARARLQSGDQRIEVSGRWLQRRGDDALELGATNLDLGTLRALLRDWVGDLPDVDGRLSGSATIGGDLERQPTLRVDATLADGRIGAVPGVDGSVLLQYDPGVLVADLGVVVRDSGELEVDVRGAVDTNVRLRDALVDAAFHVDAVGRDVDLALLRYLPVELPVLEGRVSGRGSANGGLDAFDFESELDVPALRVALPESWRREGDDPLSAPFGFGGRIGYADGALTVRGSLRDDGGQLAEAEASVLLDLRSTLEDPSLVPSLLEVAPWRLALRLPPRRVDRWPAVLRRHLPRPESFVASGTLTLRGGAYRPAGDLSAHVAWVGEEEHGCGDPSRPRVEVLARLENGATTVGATGFVDDQRVLFAEAEAATPIDAWLRDPSALRAPSTRATIWAISLPTDRLPFVCQELEGPLTASIEVERLFGSRPSVTVEVSSDALRLRDVHLDARRRPRVRTRTPPFDTRLFAQLGNGRAFAEANLTWWNAGLTRAQVGLPITWGSDEVFPTFAEDARLDGTAELVDAPLDAALFWLPQVSEAHGGLFGQLDVRGTSSAPLLEGEIVLRDGRLAIPSLGQRLDDIEGVLVLEGQTLVLQRFEAHDGDGVATIAGDISLDRFSPQRADLALDASSFPVRQEGAVLARLTGEARLGADFHEGGLEGDLFIDGLSVWIGDDAGRTPQSLADHPDVIVLGREEDAPGDEVPYAVSLHIDARRPFTIKGDDFASELVATLELGYVEALQLKGEVELRAGHFDIFGKRFEVERGALLFDGEVELDPAVNLVAIHELRSRAGETVTVTASGRLSDPQIRFTSTLTNDRAEIVALLVSGEVRGDTAQDVERAPTDFLAGIAAGVLTLSLREEFGQVIPTIVVEGNRYGGTRIRGGWRLEDVLPESLRRVIQGVYIEGFFNTSGQDGEGSRRTVGQVLDYGFLLELALPRNVVNTNTFTPPNNFSLDVTWQP